MFTFILLSEAIAFCTWSRVRVRFKSWMSDFRIRKEAIFYLLTKVGLDKQTVLYTAIISVALLFYF